VENRFSVEVVSGAYETAYRRVIAAAQSDRSAGQLPAGLVPDTI
jgi:hypothetical protein